MSSSRGSSMKKAHNDRTVPAATATSLKKDDIHIIAHTTSGHGSLGGGAERKKDGQQLHKTMVPLLRPPPISMRRRSSGSVDPEEIKVEEIAMQGSSREEPPEVLAAMTAQQSLASTGILSPHKKTAEKRYPLISFFAVLLCCLLHLRLFYNFAATKKDYAPVRQLPEATQAAAARDNLPKLDETLSWQEEPTKQDAAMSFVAGPTISRRRATTWNHPERKESTKEEEVKEKNTRNVFPTNFKQKKKKPAATITTTIGEQGNNNHAPEVGYDNISNPLSHQKQQPLGVDAGQKKKQRQQQQQQQQLDDPLAASLRQNDAIIGKGQLRSSSSSSRASSLAAATIVDSLRQSRGDHVRQFVQCLSKQLPPQEEEASLQWVTLLDGAAEQHWQSYEEARSTWNSAYLNRQYPDVVTFPGSAEQVSAVVKCALASGHRLCGRNGRHSFEGDTCQHGVLVDVSRIQHVQLLSNNHHHNATTTTTTGAVRLGAGMTLGKVAVEVEAQYGIVVPIGNCASVGLTGAVLVGGHGVLSRLYGLSSDYVSAVELVDAHGNLVRATASNQYADYLWMARGGGSGVFHFPGIITAIELTGLPKSEAAVPSETVFTMFRVDHRSPTVENAVQLLQAWQDFYLNEAHAQDPLLDRLTVEPWLFLMPSGKKGQYKKKLYFVCYFYGTLEHHKAFKKRYLDKVMNLIADPNQRKVGRVERLTSLEFRRRLGGVNTDEELAAGNKGWNLGDSWKGYSAVARRAVAANAFRSLAQGIYETQPLSKRYAELKALGGAIARPPKSVSAFWFRGSAWWVLVNHFFPTTEADAILLRSTRAQHDRFVEAMGDAFAGMYSGYIDRSNALGRDPRSYYGDHASRLQEIKESRDPENRFRVSLLPLPEEPQQLSPLRLHLRRDTTNNKHTAIALPAAGSAALAPAVTDDSAAAVATVAAVKKNGQPSSEKTTPPQWLVVNEHADITARHEACFVMVDRKAYLLLGRRHRRDNNRVDIYDPVSRTWSKGAAPPLELHHAQCVAADHKIWIVSSWTGKYPQEKNTEFIYVYDPTNDSWSTRVGLPEHRRRGSAAAVLVGRRIYVSHGNRGGHELDNFATSYGWLDYYDIDKDKWTTDLPDAPHPRDHAGGALVNGNKICVAGGRNGGEQGFFDKVILPTDCFDLSTGRWEVHANIPKGRGGAFYGTTCDGKLMIAGGEGFGKAWSNVDVFDGSKWTSLGNLNVARHGAGLAVDCKCNQIHVASGSGDQGGTPELSSVETFFPGGVDEACTA